MVSLISLSAGLIVFSPWLMALLVAAVIPAFLGENHYSKLAYSVLYRRTPQRRQLDYLRLLGASAQSAKEVKIFGLGDVPDASATAASRRASRTRTASLSIRRAIAGSALNLIATGGYYGAYVAVLARTLAGAISLGMFTFLTGAFSRSRSYIENMLSSFNDITEEAMYLKDLFEFLEIRPTIHSLPGSIPAPRPIRAGFEFQNVTFAYPGARSLSCRTLISGWTLGKGRAYRPEWGRENDAGEAFGATLRPDGRPHSAGRHRPARVRRGGPAPGDRRDLPGLHEVRRDCPREYRVRQHRRAGRPGADPRRRRSRVWRRASSTSFPAASTRWWDGASTAGWTSRAANGRSSRWRGLTCATRSC